VITGMNGSVGNAKVMYLFRTRGLKPLGTVTVGTPTTEFTSGDPVQQTISCAGKSDPTTSVIAFCAYTSDNTPSGVSFTPQHDAGFETNDINGTLAHISTRHRIFTDINADDVTVDMGDPGTNNILASFYLQTKTLY
jgi:hypothetical protein